MTPQKHIYEQQSINNWQNQDYKGPQGQFKPGTGIITITGRAPIGSTVEDQALTQESLITSPYWKPRIATYINGNVSGTPSSIFSGLGINYNSSNPGNLIIK